MFRDKSYCQRTYVHWLSNSVNILYLFAGHALLDLSSAFDTVDHEILLSLLTQRFCVRDTAYDWCRSYLSCSRIQSFNFADQQTGPYPLDCSVPQGSVLGPLKFIAYTVIQRTASMWLSTMTWMYICMRTTRSCMTAAIHITQPRLVSVCLTARLIFLRGVRLIDCNWMLIRQKWSGSALSTI